MQSEFDAKIDIDKRKKTAKNHSATHLLQSALRQVLGDHVQQKGSLVNEKLLRFDFAHFAKLTDDEIAKVESIVNQKIAEEIKGTIEADVNIDEAKSRGVTALFGEKYGEKVRVVTFDPAYSMELCGGTHVSNTSELGFFKIISESSIAAGVRRIEATTSSNVLEFYQQKETTLNEISAMLKHPQKLNVAVQNLATENTSLKKSIANYELIIANSELEKIIATQPSDSLVFASYDNLSMDILKAMSSRIRTHFTDKLSILATKEDDKLKLIVLAGDAYIQAGKPDAKAIVKEISPIIKGGGGGQPTQANAVGDIATDLNVVKEKVKGMIG